MGYIFLNSLLSHLLGNTGKNDKNKKKCHYVLINIPHKTRT